MKNWIFLSICLLITFSTTVISQNSKGNRVSGIVTDVDGAPVKGAMIFVNFVKIKGQTNKKGIYKARLNSKSKTLSVYSPVYGVLSEEVTGKSTINFKFTEGYNPISEEQLKELGFTLETKNNTDWYADFSSILEILDKRFYNVRVTNGEIIIGKGANQFNGDTTPLILVDNQQRGIDALVSIATSDVKLIRVISRGSEAAQYGGLKAANGVILITLKQ